ncbi:MAG: LysR family transcriptional regulator [Myxococcota bacterium]
MKPSDLNYQHLRYFRAVAHEGSVLRASRALHLAPSTVSGQIKTLETQLGSPLLTRAGRNLVLTEFGRTVLRYADDIFETGDDLVRNVVMSERRDRARVGVSSVLPKLLTSDLLRLALTDTVELHLEHGSTEELLGRLARRRLDVVLSDADKPSWLGTRGYAHPVVETGIAVFGAKKHADIARLNLPQSLSEVPWLVPQQGTSLRSGLEVWWDEVGLDIEIAAVVDDSALLKALGDAGFGVFAAPAIMQDAIVAAFDVECICTTDRVVERVFAIAREEYPASDAIRKICGIQSATSQEAPLPGV